MTDNTQFIPVAGEEYKIMAHPNSAGNVYFSTDTGKIFMDYDSENRIVMSGSGGAVFYASDKDVINTGFGSYYVHMDALDESVSIPRADDIIINTEDKCFYRVSTRDNDNGVFECVRIAVAGNGGNNTGEGPSGSGGGAYGVHPVGSTDLNVIWGEDCWIEFDIEAKDSSGADTYGGYLSFSRGMGNSPSFVTGIPVKVGRNRLNIKDYLLNDPSGVQILKGHFSLDVGTENPATPTQSWRITIVDIKLSWDYDSSTINNEDNLILKWMVAGGASVPKVSNIIIDDIFKVTHPVKTTGEQTYTFNRSQYNLSHGKHKFEMYVEYEVNGETRRIKESIVKELIFVDSGDTTPIIALGDYKTQVDQYDTLMLPIYIYNSSSATLIADGFEQETWEDLPQNATSATLRYWSYNSTEAGTHKLIIVCGSVEYGIDIIVNPLELSTEEVSGYAFKIKASDFTSNNALQTWSCQNPSDSSNPIKMIFSDNFDWVNGGLKQELDENNNLRQFICIKAGTYLTINYDLFKVFNAKYGKDIKIIFKVNNCGKYDAEIIRSYDENTQKGLIMTAQSALFKSESNSIVTQYCEENYTEYEVDITPFAQDGSKDLQYIMPWLVGVPAGITTFQKDSFNTTNPTKIKIGSEDCDVCIYMVKVYEKHLTNNEHLANFIMDALNAKEIISRYTRNDVLMDSGNGEIDWRKVVEKNPNCWVHLYKIPRISKTKKDEIGKDYLKNGTGEVAKYYALYKDGDYEVPALQAGTDVNLPFSYKVQGTSSEKYVISAANLDTKFKNGFIDKNGEVIKKFSLDSTVPGENYFNTKVNVASCEGANNALNAALYNDYQPYETAAKGKNPKKRDTMLFKPGLVFIYDENKLYDITNTTTQSNLDLNIFKGNSNYKSNPFYKQYAICNFGNSKKNVATLHDTDNPSEVCIEVTDNQNIGQHMCRVSGVKNVKVTVIDETTGQEKEVTEKQFFDITNEDINDPEIYQAFINTMDDGDYDVRYTSAMEDVEDPGNDGVANASRSQIIGFFNLVKWFALNDPCEYNPDTHPYGWKKNSPLPQPVTFAPYQFKSKITFETGEELTPEKKEKYGQNGDYYKHSYSSELGGFIVDTYAGTYTEDSHNYRMAKLLSECEDHLVMDSIVYHYLFIQRHLMVDNVAKNTFWTSEDKDNRLWSLVKDYDNDTADGIDNSGKLSFTYGVEPTDLQSNGISFFNAPNSVWFNFLHGLDTLQRDSSVCQKLYQKLKPTGVWDAQSYIEKFEAWQNVIPERCWVEDYYRKYIRPYEIYNDTGYLAMLEGGQKKYQRKQFEQYQDLYLGTKYETNESSYIDIRANAEKVKGISIPVTMYSDCYIFQSWSQNIIKIRAKRGQEYIVTCPSNISSATDATIYWYNPQSYSTIGDIGTLYPKSVKLGEAKRLQSLTITGGESHNLSSYTTSELSIEQATLIKHLKLTDLTALNTASDGSAPAGIPLDLTALKSLQDFDGRNSLFTSVDLPAGAPITSVKLANPRIISAKDLNHLQEFTLENFNNLSTLLLSNIDNTERVNSLQNFIYNVLNSNSFNRYCLQNVKWVLKEAGHINDTNHTIDFLELLRKQGMSATDFKGQSNVEFKDGLSGTLLITKEAYSGQNPLSIYEKYISIFPNLDISFEAEECKLDEVVILDGNGKKAWSRKFFKEASLTRTFFGSGIPGAFVDTVMDVIRSKQSTVDTVYTFDNKWSIKNTSTILSVSPVEGNPSSYCPASGEKITNSITIEPIFTSKVRQYKVSYFDDSGVELYSETVDYGTNATDISSKFAASKDDSRLAEEKTYRLDGWSIFMGQDKLGSYDQLQIKSDMNFYAVFKECSVYDNVLPEEYFNFQAATVSSNSTQTIVLDAPKTGYRIWLKDTIRLKGKITYPSYFKGLPVLLIGQSNSGSGKTKDGITHVFFKEDSQIIVFESGAFWNWNTLQYIKLPEKIQFIGSNMFQDCPLLKLPTIEHCKQLKYIGDIFYVNSGTGREEIQDVSEYYIPGSVKVINEGFIFNSNSKIKITHLYIGDSQNPTELCIEPTLGYFGIFEDSVLRGIEYVSVWYKNKPVLSYNTVLDYIENLWKVNITSATEVS